MIYALYLTFPLVPFEGFFVVIPSVPTKLGGVILFCCNYSKHNTSVVAASAVYVDINARMAVF